MRRKNCAWRETNLATLCALVAATAIPLPAAGLDAVLIDADVKYQVMEGFGISSRLFDDPHVFNDLRDPVTGRAQIVMTKAEQDEVLDGLFIDLGLTRLRPVNSNYLETQSSIGIEPVNDNSDPGVADPVRFDFSWKRLDDHVALMSRARGRGAGTLFLSPLFREAWMGTTTANDAAEYAEWLLAQVRRSAELGVRLPFLSVSNEPSYSRNTMSGGFIRDVIKNLGPRLRAEGFDTLFVTPDDVRASDAAAKAQIILSDPISRSYVGALATHLYDEPVTNVGQMAALAAQYQLPLWMTEFSVGAMGTTGRLENAFSWASLMHDLIATYNVSAIDYLWGYSAQSPSGFEGQLIGLDYAGATYLGPTPNKSYYTTGQFSRFVQPGTRRIAADSSNIRVQTTAYLDSRRLVVIANNADHASREVVFTVSGIPAAETMLFEPTRTSATENWATLPTVAMAGQSFAATLPANSITTFAAALTDIVFSSSFESGETVAGTDATANRRADFRP